MEEPLLPNKEKKIPEWKDYLWRDWTTYLACEILKSKLKSKNKLNININIRIDILYKYEALLTQCSYLSRLAYVPADIFCRMTEHLDITPNAFNDYIKAIEDIYDDLFKYKCSYDSKYIQEHPKFKEKFNPYNFENSEQQNESKKLENSNKKKNPESKTFESNSPEQQNKTEKFNDKKIKNSTPIGYFIQNEKKLNAYIYLHHNKDSKFNNTPTLYISFKGSSNFNDFWHDLKSAVYKNIPLWELDITNPVINNKNNGKASSVFIKILTKSITDIYNRVINLIKTEKEKETNLNLRIIITGHSLGGAFAELFGYYLKKYKSKEITCPITCPIHIITFGSCCVFDAAGRNEFNSQLNIVGPNVFTLDRITVNGDPVVLLPAHLDHGGYTLLKTEYKAFTQKGRTNEIGELRKMLGLDQGESKENYDGNDLLVSKAFIQLFKNSDHFIKNDKYNFQLYKEKYKNITPNIFKNKQKKLNIKQEAMPNLKQSGGVEPPAGVPESQSYEFRKNTKIYKDETLTKMPNQINYSCYKIISKGFCHGVYMGVSYMNVLRLIGDKDPVKDYILYKTKTRKIFSLPEDGECFSHKSSECSLSNNEYIEPNINPSGFNTIKSTSRCSIM